MPRNEAERAAQERYNVPREKAGLDHIARPMDREKFREGWERCFGKKKKQEEEKKSSEE